MTKRQQPARRRRIGNRPPKQRIAVVCEGRKTEPLYLKWVEAFSKSSLLELVIVDTHVTSPKQLVQRACEVRGDAARIAKKTGDPNEIIDQVWCVFDVDEHPNLDEACDQARANAVELAISNPCVELWFLLHFQNQSAYLDRHEALAKLKSHMPSYEKRVDDIRGLESGFEVAKQRALALDDKHAGDSTEFPQNNPSSGLYRLVSCERGSFTWAAVVK